MEVGDQISFVEGLWVQVAGPAFVDERDVVWVPFLPRTHLRGEKPLTVMASFVLRIRKAPEVVARELMA